MMSWNHLVHLQQVIVWPVAGISWMARDFCLAVEWESKESVEKSLNLVMGILCTGIEQTAKFKIWIQKIASKAKIWIPYDALKCENFIGSIFIPVVDFVADR